MKNPGLLPEIFNGVSSENSRVKFKSAKILRGISEKILKYYILRWIFL